MSTSLLFIAGLAIVILFGFLAGLLFRATRIPDILIVMGAGIAIGPYGAGWITPAELEPILPPFTTLALLMILFTGGLGLPLGTVVRGAPVATLFSVIVFAGSVVLTALACSTLLGWSFSEGLLLGAIVGGTSSAVVLGLLRGAPMSEGGQILLSLESTITDVLCITCLMALIQLLTEPDTSMGDRMTELGRQFGIGIVVGGVSGFGWGDIARRARKLRLEFMATLAVVFLTYVGVELAGGSGAVAAVAFGVVMASSRGRIVAVRASIPPAGSLPPPDAAAKETQDLRTFHDELAFLLRTLFFIVLGIRFPLVNPGARIWLLLGAIIVGWVLVRRLVAWPISRLGGLGRRDRFGVVNVFPRGMVAAVLATLPTQYALADGTPLLSPERGADFVLISFLVIGLTTLWASFAVFFVGRVRDDAAKAP
jgi:potassium/hydrogen antiporter